MHGSRENFGDYGICGHEKNQKSELTRRLREVLKHPDQVENYEVVRPSDSVRHLSIAISRMGLTLNDTPLGDPKFRVEAKLFGPYDSDVREGGKLISRNVVAFDDVYRYEGAGDRYYRSYYDDSGRRKKGSTLVIVFKDDVGSLASSRPKLTAQDIKWDENCTYGACIKYDDIKWFSISYKDTNGDDLRPVFFRFETIDPTSEKAAELNARLEKFLQWRENMAMARKRRILPWLGWVPLVKREY